MYDTDPTPPHGTQRPEGCICDDVRRYHAVFSSFPSGSYAEFSALPEHLTDRLARMEEHYGSLVSVSEVAR